MFKVVVPICRLCYLYRGNIREITQDRPNGLNQRSSEIEPALYLNVPLSSLLRKVLLHSLGKLIINQNLTGDNSHARRARDAPFVRFGRACPIGELRRVVDTLGRDAEESVEPRHGIRHISYSLVSTVQKKKEM